MLLAFALAGFAALTFRLSGHVQTADRSLVVNEQTADTLDGRRKLARGLKLLTWTLAAMSVSVALIPWLGTGLITIDMGLLTLATGVAVARGEMNAGDGPPAPQWVGLIVAVLGIALIAVGIAQTSSGTARMTIDVHRVVDAPGTSRGYWVYDTAGTSYSVSDTTGGDLRAGVRYECAAEKSATNGRLRILSCTPAD